MDTSAIPAAIDGLVALCTGQVAPGGLLERVIVFDGPPFTKPSEQQLLFIGDTPDDLSSVSGTQDFAHIGARQRDEDFSIYCTAVSRSGGTDMKVERDRAFRMKGAVEKLLRPGFPGADITLGGAVMWAHVSGEITLSQITDPNGAMARLGFHVVCRARLT